MKYRTRILVCFTLLIGTIFISCRNHVDRQKETIQKQSSNEDSMKKNADMPFPPVIIYKTKTDLSKNVPVSLSSDKSMILSYPDVKDVYYNGLLSYPVKLSKGYLLDNRGIGPDVAFLDYTYEEYSNLPVTPAPEELFARIINKDPLTEMYRCKCKRDTSIINEIIDSGKLYEACKKLK
jgi:hypothetical protein